jgi:hypothetical protein
MVETQYLPTAIDVVTLEKFTVVLKKAMENKRVLISMKMLWSLCRTGPMLQRVTDVVMVPYLLKQEVDNLIAADESYTAVDGLLQAAEA